MDILEQAEFPYVGDDDMSANQLYKRSGSTMSFKDWIAKAKEVGVFDPNLSVRDRFNRIFSTEGLWKINDPQNNINGKEVGLFGMPPLLSTGLAVTAVILISYGIMALVRKE